MIEYFTIDGREMPLSIRASTTTRRVDRFSWIQKAKDIKRLGKKYHIASEKLIFFDDEPGVSIAAQLSDWISTNIPKGRHFVFVPGDTLMYCAELHIHADYVLVDSESLLSFDQAIEQIRQEPLASHIHASGDLQAPLEQNGFDLKDLHIELAPDSSNPYWLKRGRSLNELTGGAAFLLVMAGLGVATVQNYYGSEEKKVFPIMIKEAVRPQSYVQLHNDLGALTALLSASSVWMNYGLENITIVKSDAGYTTRLEGKYRNNYPLARLREITGKMDGQLMLQGDGWFMETPIFKPDPGYSDEPVDILDSIEHYRRLVSAGYADLDIDGISDGRPLRTANLELRIDRPVPWVLAGIARQVERHNIHGAAQRINVAVKPGHGWQQLSIDINLSGI